MDVSFASADEAKSKLRLFKALVKDCKSRAERQILEADEAHMAARAEGSAGIGRFF